MTASEVDSRVEELYRQHGTQVLAYLARRTTSPEDAADLLSEVFSTMWRRRSSLPPSCEDRLWMYGIAHHMLANNRRSRRRRSGALLQVAEQMRHAAPADPLGAYLEVRQALAELPRIDQEIITLSVWEGMSSAEISIVLKLPAGTIRSRLHRARNQLRKKLATGELTLEASPDRAHPEATLDLATGGRNP